MNSILGGLSPAAFLRDYWQKRPLLVRQAFPGFKGIIDRDRFLSLATRDDARSRLIIHHPAGSAGGAGRRARSRARWERHDGPFGGLDIGMLPRSHWTLLVNSVESLVPGGWEILSAFSMIPMARIDDLMVSYAGDGGTVGPHDDLYDVFLLQGPGRRRWQISTQRDRSVDPDAAIRVLRSFVPEADWLLEPGDMLYLPPGIAHWGVAEGPCFTYSIGFLAPSHGELVQSFFEYLGATLGARMDPDAHYQDADLRLQKEPLAVSGSMIEKLAVLLADADRNLGRDRTLLADFLGRYLTRPKPRHVFARPARPVTEAEFARAVGHRRGLGLGLGRGRLGLALPSRGLLHGRRIFLNGEAYAASPPTLRLFKQLVRQRALPLPLSDPPSDRILELLHSWYAAGYLRLHTRE
jgi:50S ribosomal protein L16 3-hydroxylase